MLHPMTRNSTAASATFPPPSPARLSAAAELPSIDCFTIARMPLSQLLYHLLTGSLKPVSV